MLIDISDDPVLETFAQQLAGEAAASPAARARLEELARAAWCWALEAEACGWLRILHAPDGSIVLEILDRRLH